MSRLRNIFLTGLLLLVPAVITVWILQMVFEVLDGLTQPLLVLYVGRQIPGAGVVLTAMIVLFLGALSNLIVGQRLVTWVEAQIGRIPFVRSVYSTTRQVVQGFSSAEGVNFKRAVLVRQHEGTLTVGFVTRDLVLAEGGSDRRMIAVYVPTNHLYLGDVFLLTPERVLEVDLSLEEAISAVLSCGGSMPQAVATLASSLTEGEEPARLETAPPTPGPASSSGRRTKRSRRGR